jgi:filamentous hemagglutinin family protein
MKLLPGIISTFLTATAIAGIEPLSAGAQIAGAADGTNTLVNQSGSTFNITGGTQAGANLFHSFQRFGLNQGQIANFLSNPSIQNILGRVSGGEASVVNGLIQVTGAHSNLYLMNPAGIIFGPNASLNVSGSFLATTANGIGFDRPISGGAGGWFNATGTNDYATLTGAPTSLAFTALQPTAIVNSANLAVNQGNNLALLGGTVTSTGQLSAPGGLVTVASLPGQSLVRISAAGQILSLEIRPVPVAASSADSSQTSLSLPELLTGGNGENATGLTVNSDGTVTLNGSGLQVQNGDVVVKAVTAKIATLSATHNLTLVESQLQTTGDLNLLAQNKVQVRDSIANPVVARAAGNLQVQGNQGIDILALNHPEPAFQSGGNLSLISNGIVSGDAHFATGGNFSILNLAGQTGTFVSLHDPIISAAGNVTFGSYTGAALKVEATGSITANGDITINAPDATLAPGPAGSDRQILRTLPALILRAGLTTLQESSGVANPSPTPPFSFNEPVSGTTFNASTASAPKRISINGSITTTPASGSAGPVILAAPDGITVTGTIDTSATGAITANGGTVTLRTTTGNIQVQNIQSSGAGSPFGQTGSVNLLSSTGNISALGTISNIDRSTFSTAGNIIVKRIQGNSINLTSTGGGVTIQDSGDPSVFSLNGGSRVEVAAKNDIQALGPIFGNLVKLTSTDGNVFVNYISARGGGVEINAAKFFQATGSSILPSGSFRVKLKDAPEILSFLQSRGINADPNSTVTVPYGGKSGVPFSINASEVTTLPAGSPNAQIIIRFGGATRTLVDRQFPVVVNGNNGTGFVTTQGRILIQGGNGAFFLGPAVVGKLAPGISDPFVIRDNNGNFVRVSSSNFGSDSTLYRNEAYSTQFPSNQFPANISGTVGAILVGFGNNETLFGAVQSQPFNAINPDNGNPGNPGSGGSSSGSSAVGSNPGGGSSAFEANVTRASGETIQRQLNNQNQATACTQATTIAAAPSDAGKQPDRASSNAPVSSGPPCTSAESDEAQILTILEETPGSTQNKGLNLGVSTPKTPDFVNWTDKW